MMPCPSGAARMEIEWYRGSIVRGAVGHAGIASEVEHPAFAERCQGSLKRQKPLPSAIVRARQAVADKQGSDHRLSGRSDVSRRDAQNPPTATLRR
jgi:hypothetical protein